MKIFQITGLNFNNSNNRQKVAEPKSLAANTFAPQMRPMLNRDTVSFTAKKIPSLMTPTLDDIIHKRKPLEILYLNLLRLAKYDIPCPVCGHLMLDLDKYNAFEEKIMSTTDPTKILKYIGELEKYLHPIEKKVFEMMKADNLKNPKMTLHDMLKSRLPESESKIVSMQTQILANMGILSRNLNENERISVQNLLNETFNRIIDPRETSRFSRRTFLTKLKNIFIPEHIRANLKLKFINEFEFMDKGTEYYTELNKNLYVQNKLNYIMTNWIYTPEQDKIIEEAVKMPKAYNNMDAFNVKYAKRDYKRANPDQKIALRMLSNSLVTIEHIKPQFYNGPDVPGNLSLECACDNSRNNAEGVIEQISENPLMPIHYKRFMKRLCQIHQDGNVEKCYMPQLNKTYREESYGFLDANLSILSKPRKKSIKEKMRGTPTKAERREARKLKLKGKKKTKFSKKSKQSSNRRQPPGL